MQTLSAERRNSGSGPPRRGSIKTEMIQHVRGVLEEKAHEVQHWLHAGGEKNAKVDSSKVNKDF